jgi:O-antigen/teichoic acid export membrane protein
MTSAPASVEQPSARAGGGVYKKLLRSTAVYSLSVIAERAAAFVMLPLYTRFLTTADYGTLELLNLTASLVGMFLGVRLGQSLFFFYFNATSTKEQNLFISTAFLGSCMAAIVLVAIALPFCPEISQYVFATKAYSFCFKLLFVSLGASLPVEVGLSYLRVTEQAALFVKVSLCRLVGGVALNVMLLVACHLGVTALLWSSVTLAVTTAVWMSRYCLFSLGGGFSSAKLLTMVRYSFPLGVSGLAMFVVHYCDRLFLRVNTSLDQVGLYALAYQFGWLIAVVQIPFSIYWNAQALAILREPDGEKAYIRVGTYLSLGLTAVAVLLSVFIRPTLYLMVSPAFRECAAFVPCIAAAYVVRAMADYCRYILVLEKRTNWDAGITVAGGVTALLGYWYLIPRFKLWGAVEATALAFVIMLVIGAWTAQRVRPFHYEVGRLVKIVICGGIPIGVTSLVHPSGFGAQLLLGLVLAGSFPALLFFSGFLAEDEQSSLRTFFSARRGVVRTLAGMLAS